jgi:hypothetical protein
VAARGGCWSRHATSEPFACILAAMSLASADRDARAGVRQRGGVMRTSPWLTVLRAVATLLLGALAWAVLGYLATAPLGVIYGWQGHPSVPAAPAAVYVGLYLVALPAVCLWAAWFLIGLVIQRVGGRPKLRT